MAETKIVDLPFFFSVDHIPPRKRRPDTVRLSATLPVEIRSLSLDEAPIAISYGPEGAAYELREVGGRLYQPLVEDQRISLGRFAREAAERRHWGLAIFAPDRPRWSGRDYPLARTGDELRSPSMQDFVARQPVGRIVSDDRAMRQAEAQARLAGDLVEVDLGMWVALRYEEPCISVSYDDSDSKRAVTVTPCFGRPEAPNVHTFRFDRGEDALSFARELARNRKASLDSKLDALRIAEGVSFKRDDTVAIARQMLATFGQMMAVAFRPTTEVRDLIDLSNRFKIENHPEPLRERDYARVLARIEELVDAGVRFGPGARRYELALKLQVQRLRRYERNEREAALALVEEEDADVASLAL